LKGDDHDADAFYLPTADSATCAAEHVALVLAKSWNYRATFSLGQLAYDMLSKPLAMTTDRPPSGSSVWHCALILQLRTLRI
jgi:hypothetical protein